MQGKELKEIRLKLGLTQKEMADLLGYSHYNRISYFERNVEKIPKTTAKLARMYLKCSQCQKSIEFTEK